MKKILALLKGLVSSKQHPSNDVPDSISLEFDDKSKQAIRDLMIKSNNQDIIQLIIVSLAINDMSVDHVIGGGKIIYREQDGTEKTFNPLTKQLETGS
jgi:hypothetical protein